MSYLNLYFLEPLEQFEIVKINYEWWFNNYIVESFILIILNLKLFYFNNNITNFDILLLLNEYITVIDTYNDLITNFALLTKHNIDFHFFFPEHLLFLFNIDTVDFLIISHDFFDSFLLLNTWDENFLIWGYTLNSTIYYIILLLLLLFFLFLPIMNNLYLIPTNWQFIFENLYKFVAEMLEAQIGKEAQRFLPYIFSIFLFILTSNMLGMTLFSFTLTSHIMVTFTLGVSTFIGLTILGFVIQKIKFLNLFIPKGIPAVLLPMLIIIEIISYFSRALSLSIRLFANLMSGHTLLHILAFFSSKLFKYKFIVGLISFILILAIVALEFCIALLQAYVFAILICIYLNDAFHASH